MSAKPEHAYSAALRDIVSDCIEMDRRIANSSADDWPTRRDELRVLGMLIRKISDAHSQAEAIVIAAMDGHVLELLTHDAEWAHEALARFDRACRTDPDQHLAGVLANADLAVSPGVK